VAIAATSSVAVLVVSLVVLIVSPGGVDCARFGLVIATFSVVAFAGSVAYALLRRPAEPPRPAAGAGRSVEDGPAR
jgi:hypothetical protein